MKVYKQVRKYGRQVAVAGGVTLMAVGNAMAAALDISASTTQATADIQAAGVLVIGVVVAAVAFSWVRRVIK